MEILITIAAFLVLVGIVVTIHEGGHFFTALACKMGIIEFSIGFGPKILQRRIGKQQILFTLRAFPLGGFVKPLDQTTVSPEVWEKLTEEHKQTSFMNSPRWKKALMVAGGPLSNFVLAFFVFIIAFSLVGNKGLPPVIGEVLPNSVVAKSGLKEGDTISSINGKTVNFVGDAHSLIANAAINGETINIKTEDNKNLTVNFSQLNLHELGDDLGKLTGVYFQGSIGEITIKKVTEDGVAAKNGLTEGDTIISVNGVESKDINKILRVIRNNPGKTVEVKYMHDQQELVKKITLDSKNSSGVLVGKLGVEFETPDSDKLKTVHMGIIDSASEAFDRVTSSTWTTIVSIKKLVTGEISTKAISGPLSIADYSGKSAQRGLFPYLMMMAAISIAVGVFNLLPVPMLDGGHLMQYAIEGVRGKSFTIKQLENIQYVGIAMMTGMFTLAITNDLVKYLGFLG